MNEDGEISEFSFFEWRIPDFFSLATKDVLQSPIFSFSGCTWYLEMYRISVVFQHSALYLCMKDGTVADKTLIFTLDFKGSNGTMENEIRVDKKLENYFKMLTYDGMKFLSLDDLRNRKSELVPSDILTVTCACRLEGDKSFADTIPQKQNPGPESFGAHSDLENLSSDLQQFFDGKKKCDVTILVQDKRFQSHRAVLMARSPVFCAMFEHDTKEAQEGIVNDPDSDPESFGKFLKYLYTGKMDDVSPKDAFHLYVTTDKYDVQGLKSFCAEFLVRNVHTENVCDVATLGERYEDAQLSSSAQNFFNQNFDKICRTAEWKKLLRTNYQLADNLLEGLGSTLKMSNTV